MKILFLILVLGFSVFAQCNLTLKDAPVIRGLRLEMPDTEFIKIFPGPEYNPRRSLLDSNELIIGSELRKAEGFLDIWLLNVAFKDFKADSIEIKYSRDLVRWDNVKEFAENLSNNFKLPNIAWKFIDDKKAKMNCEEFIISIDSSENQIYLEKYFRTIKGVDKKKAFKP